MKSVIVSALVAAGVVMSAPAFANADLAKAKNCLSCHAADKKVVGPSYQDVAKKYAGQKDAEAKLAEKIQKGGSGVWGNVPMPPNNVTPEEAKKLAAWVMGGAK
ncbi:MAG TPA: c-type cytochrome [Rhodocyclaceae bacterium]|jgi:cytochrome c|nr:c-type cytochrome [Rhodocyclaceae bacterium]